MSRLYAVAVLACALALVTTAADARPKQARTDSQELRYCASDQTYRHSCGEAGKRIQRHASGAGRQEIGVRIIGGRPPGCPHRYCGCGLRKYLGIEDSRLDVAWNWAVLFPRVTAQPGAAAVKRHHVMLLVSHVAGRNWIVRNYNGNRGLSSIVELDVSGYIFVDPSFRVGDRQ